MYPFPAHRKHILKDEYYPDIEQGLRNLESLLSTCEPEFIPQIHLWYQLEVPKQKRENLQSTVTSSELIEPLRTFVHTKLEQYAQVSETASSHLRDAGLPRLAANRRIHQGPYYQDCTF